MRAFYFDCLRRDEVSLAERPARERFAVLSEVVPAAQLIPRLVTRSRDAAAAFYDEAVAQGHEGLMAKSLDAPYEAGNRGASWLKIKRAHTLDLVVLAAEWGHGRRQGKLSNLHLGAFDSDTAAVRDARQDLQGNDRRDARVADTRVPGARVASRSMDGVRSAGNRGRDRVQRSAGQPALSGRPGAEAGARETIPRRTSASRRRTRWRPSGRSSRRSDTTSHTSALDCHRRVLDRGRVVRLHAVSVLLDGAVASVFRRRQRGAGRHLGRICRGLPDAARRSRVLRPHRRPPRTSPDVAAVDGGHVRRPCC